MLFQDIEAILSERGKDWSDVKGVEINDVPLSFGQFKSVASEITIYADCLEDVAVIGVGWWIYGACKWDPYYQETEDHITLTYEEHPTAREPIHVDVDEFVRKLTGKAYQITLTHGPVKHAWWRCDDTVGFSLGDGEWYEITFSIRERNGKKYYIRDVRDREGKTYRDMNQFDVFNKGLTKEDYAQWTADNWCEIEELIERGIKWQE